MVVGVCVCVWFVLLLWFCVVVCVCVCVCVCEFLIRNGDTFFVEIAASDKSRMRQ